jgi:ribonuclease BN (tRNA processing enzyme)
MERFVLVPLGAGGYIPAGRQTMSFLVERGEHRAILDAGSGLARLVEPGVMERLARAPRLDIALSHFHLDHVIGLSYLPGVWSHKPTRILAPRPPLVDGEPEVALDHLLSPPLFPISWREFPGPLALETYDDAGFELLGARVRVRRQRHAGASAAMRFGDRLVYATDTEPDEATIEFARGAETLIHELWLDDDDAAANPAAMRGHSATAAVARIARLAGVRRLIPVHHHPRYDAERVEGLARRLRADFGGEVVVPREGVAIEL